MLLDPPPTPMTMDSEASATEALRHALDRAAAAMKDTFQQRLSALYSTVLASPGTVLTLFIVISAVFAQQGMAFQEQIDGDVEIFLPDGASSTDLLLEVRTEWSTDLAVIYITTPNAKNPNDTTNITDEVILNEISWLEGDDRNIGGDSTSRGMDFDKDDHAKGIIEAAIGRIDLFNHLSWRDDPQHPVVATVVVFVKIHASAG